MTSRAEQREATRERIVEAAVEAFAARGFRGASTREIAQRAGTNQGLITYHFRSKDDLWRAAADRIFGLLRSQLRESLSRLESDDLRERSRQGIRAYVRFAAEHPELFRMMVEEGKSDDDRMRWLVDTHMRTLYEGFRGLGGAGLDPALVPHAHYVLAGAASLIFAVAPECRHLTGLDPESELAIERHGEFLARLLVP